MKKIAAMALSLILVGCSKDHSTEAQARRADSPQPNVSVLRIQWLHQITKLENTYTERTYQCMTEMYSLAYRPVESGPICRESCKLLAQANAMAADAPAYIDNPQQYALGDSKVCGEKPKRTKVKLR